jgi:hypothetical protein
MRRLFYSASAECARTRKVCALAADVHRPKHTQHTRACARGAGPCCARTEGHRRLIGRNTHWAARARAAARLWSCAEGRGERSEVRVRDVPTVVRGKRQEAAYETAAAASSAVAAAPSAAATPSSCASSASSSPGACHVIRAWGPVGVSFLLELSQVWCRGEPRHVESRQLARPRRRVHASRRVKSEQHPATPSQVK